MGKTPTIFTKNVCKITQIDEQMFWVQLQMYSIFEVNIYFTWIKFEQIYPILWVIMPMGAIELSYYNCYWCSMDTDNLQIR